MGATLAVILSFTAAGIFVAEVASKSYQDVVVLATSRDCGDLTFVWSPNATTAERLSRSQSQTKYAQEKYQSSRGYAASYYGNSSRFHLGSPFVQPTLPCHGSPVPCPFDAEGKTKCLGPNLTEGPAWHMDSGVLDSHTHFGVNAPPRNRIGWRKLATCAVVDPTNFITQPFITTDNIGGTTTNNTNVGLKLQDGDWSPTALDNITFIFNLNEPYVGESIQVE